MDKTIDACNVDEIVKAFTNLLNVPNLDHQEQAATNLKSLTP